MSKLKKDKTKMLGYSIVTKRENACLRLWARQKANYHDSIVVNYGKSLC